MKRTLGPAELLSELVKRLGVSVIARRVRDTRAQCLLHLRLEAPGAFEAAADPLAQTLRGELALRHADDGNVQSALSYEACQRGKDHAECQIAGGSEKDQRIRVHGSLHVSTASARGAPASSSHGVLRVASAY